MLRRGQCYEYMRITIIRTRRNWNFGVERGDAIGEGGGNLGRTEKLKTEK